MTTVVTTVVLLGVGLRNAELSRKFAFLSVQGVSDDSLAGTDTASVLNRSLGDDGLVSVDTLAVSLQVLLDDELVGNAALAAVVRLSGNDGFVGTDTFAALGGFLGDHKFLGDDVLSSAMNSLVSVDDFLGNLLGDLLSQEFLLVLLAAALVVLAVMVMLLVQIFLNNSLDRLAGLAAVLTERKSLDGNFLDDVVVTLSKRHSLCYRSKRTRGCWSNRAWTVARRTSLNDAVVNGSEDVGHSHRRGGEEENQSDLLHL